MISDNSDSSGLFLLATSSRSERAQRVNEVIHINISTVMVQNDISLLEHIQIYTRR